MSRNGEHDPFEPSQLDLSSEPMPLGNAGQSESSSQNLSGAEPRRINAKNRRPLVRLRFGCCKLFADLRPPEHVLQGKSDVWRAHCPKCGSLVEILVE
jgi:hypothetical protein